MQGKLLSGVAVVALVSACATSDPSSPGVMVAPAGSTVNNAVGVAGAAGVAPFGNTGVNSGVGNMGRAGQGAAGGTPVVSMMGGAAGRPGVPPTGGMTG